MFMSPPNSYIEALIFGNGIYEDVIKIKWGHKGGDLIHYWCLSKKRKRHWRSLWLVWGHSKKVVIWKCRRDPSPGQMLVDTLVLDFPASKTVRYTFLLFKPPRLWDSFWQPKLTKIGNWYNFSITCQLFVYIVSCIWFKCLNHTLVSLHLNVFLVLIGEIFINKAAISCQGGSLTMYP